MGVLIVFDVTKRKSFENVDSWLKEARAHIEPYKAVYLVVGQKADLEEERQVTPREGRMYAESNGLSYIETSAFNGKNVEHCFQSLASDIHKMLEEGKIKVEEGWDGVKNGYSNPKESFHIQEGEAQGGGCC